MQTMFGNLLAASLAFCVLVDASAQDIDLNEIKPKCPAPYKEAPENGKCVPDEPKLKEVKEDACDTTLGLAWDGAQCVAKGKAPVPNCGTMLPDVVYKNGSCVVDRSIPRSAAGDYVGDYFHVIAVSDAHGRVTYTPDTWLKVLSQKKLGEQDNELTVIALRDQPWFFLRDKRVEEPTRVVRASDLIEVGASRAGWVYGALALPFKYYPSDKRFSTNVSVGPYVGRRWGVAGAAYTVAATAAVGSVTGEVRDADNNVTSTPDLLAFSIAAGVMWDISKAPNIRPFKVGLFVGKDRVSSDDAVSYKNNRKWWISFQIGYDFTDN